MVLCFLANGFEEIEALTPVDCLRRCEKEVLTVGVGGSIIKGSHGINVFTDVEDNEIKMSPSVEMIILPGGMPGTLNLEKSEAVNNAIDYCVENNIPIAAICAAPSILGHKGLLKGKNAVCYRGFENELVDANVLNANVSVDENIITASGMGAAIDFSYAIIERLISKERADRLITSLGTRQ